MDILEVYEKLINNLTELALLLNKKKLSESLEDDMSDLVKESLELVEYADKHVNDLKGENVREINDKFDDLMDTISLVIAVYNKTKGRGELAENLYKDLITNLEALGRRNWELEKKYKLGLHQLKFSLEKGKKLLNESFDKLLKDIDFSYQN